MVKEIAYKSRFHDDVDAPAKHGLWSLFDRINLFFNDVSQLPFNEAVIPFISSNCAHKVVTARSLFT